MYALHEEIGKKHTILQRVIALAKFAKDWKTPYAVELKNLFNIDTEQVDDGSMVSVCKAKLEEIKPEFLESLEKVTKLALEAGCDIALHCSGDIDEMYAVCEAINAMETV
jgi:hypothetical protein